MTSNRLASRGGRRYPPYAFTEHGTIVDALHLLMPPEEEPPREPFGFRRAKKD